MKGDSKRVKICKFSPRFPMNSKILGNLYSRFPIKIKFIKADQDSCRVGKGCSMKIKCILEKLVLFCVCVWNIFHIKTYVANIRPTYHSTFGYVDGLTLPYACTC